MDSIFTNPLDDITSNQVKDIDTLTKIPIPTIEHLQKEVAFEPKKQIKGFIKYEKEFDLFCRWSALPKDLRNPKTIKEFESKHKLPVGYNSFFKQHDEFQTRRIKYFWEWLFDLYPDVVYAVYKRALKTSSRDAAIFVDILGKHMDENKPRINVAPMVIMGIPQERIDALFTPKNYEKLQNIQDATPVEKNEE